MSYTYCVFGAGRQGVATVYDLIINCEASRVILCDPNQKVLDEAKNRLDDLLPENKCPIDTFQDVSLKVDFSRVDVILSCATWSANLGLARFAATYNVPYCDLGGNPHIVTRQGLIDTHTAIVPECGLSPGISNILAMGLAKEGFHEIQIKCGGIPVGTSRGNDPLEYKLTFDVMGLISEYSGVVPTIHDGRIVNRDTISRIVPYIRPDGSKYECSYTSNNSLAVVQSLLNAGVNNYEYMTIRYPGHWDKVKQWKTLGFLQGDDESDATLADILKRRPGLKYNRDTDEDKVILSIVGKNGNDFVCGLYGFDIVVYSDWKTKFSAMEMMTSWGITMVAHFIASNPSLVPKRFCTPENFVPSEFIMNGIKKRTGDK